MTTATVTVTAKPIPTFEAVLATLIEVERSTCKRQYGARRDVAKALIRAMPDFAWYDIPKGDKSQEGKLANAYRNTIQDSLKAVEHSNPRGVWLRICELAREELGLPPKQKAITPASEKLIASLKTALKIVQAMEAPSEAEVNVGLDLIRSLAKLGVDTIEE